MKHPDGVTQVLEDIEMALRKGNIDFKQADAARAAALAVSYRLAPKMDHALAANAEMRAALTRIHRYEDDEALSRSEIAGAALSHTDLGRGWASPEVVRRVYDVLRATRDIGVAVEQINDLLCDLAHLDDKKGGG